MTPEDVHQAFLESVGKLPHDIYFNFDVNRPLRSGSIGSVYLAKKPLQKDGMEILVPVIVKVARHNLEREFQMGSLAIELMLVSSQYWAPHSKLLPFLQAMADQIKEFTRGFEQELDFVEEADVQTRFGRRAAGSRIWHVPGVYGVAGRVLEMEFLEDAMAINRAIQSRAGSERRRFQRKVAEHFLYTVLEHLIVYQEFHGDLHPGNIMVGPDADLYLIDWGNVVDMRGKWSFIRDYLLAVLSGDIEALANCLIVMSTDPEKHSARRKDIEEALAETLRKKGVTQVRRGNLFSVYRQGFKGVQRRLQAALQLMSNTYQLGIVVQSDYLHLSRSLVAMAGTYANLYKGMSPVVLARDLMTDVALFPINFARERIFSRSGRLMNLLRDGVVEE